MMPRHRARLLSIIALIMTACRQPEPTDRLRASGYVEATEVRIAPLVGGRLIEVKVDEGSRVKPGDLIARLDSSDLEISLQRAEAEKRQAEAQLRLLQAGARTEEVRQASAQAQRAGADVEAARVELGAAEADLQRFELLLQKNAGSRKQRDDAAARRDVARARVRAAEDSERAARAAMNNVRAGARPQEIEAARARVGAADAQIAAIQKNIADATVTATAGGLVTQKLADPGEVVAPRTPLVVVTDLDNAWANVFIPETAIPRVRLGQPASVYTDAGGSPIAGSVTFISPKAEFTPRNVQTAEERSKLVYRIKVSVDNRQGILKQGMPVEAELKLSTANGE